MSLGTALSKLNRRLRKVSELRLITPDSLHRFTARTFLKKFLNEFEIDCVFDVGANRGQYATQLLSEIAFSGHVISFEPTPTLESELRSRAATYTNWHVEPFALGETHGSVVFHQMANDQFNSIHEPLATQPLQLGSMNRKAATLTVQMRTLEEVFLHWQHRLDFRRPFLKMDTQGNDLQVFRSGASCIRNFVGLQSELSFTPLYHGTSLYYEAINEYIHHGFVLSSLLPNNAGHFPRLLEMDCVMVNKAFLHGADSRGNARGNDAENEAS
jgi:FkbM family methyltransferase